MLEVAEDLWLKTLKPALEKKDIKFGRYSQLSPKRRSALDRYFDRQIFPILTPQAVDAGHPFPMISNTSINFVVELEGVHADEPGQGPLRPREVPEQRPALPLPARRRRRDDGA